MPAKNHLSQNQKQRLIKLLKESDDNYVREKVLILLLINDGKTYREISEFMEIAYTTVAYWSGEHPAFSLSIPTHFNLII